MPFLGEKNSCYLPEGTFRTFNLAKEAHPAQEYSWIQIPGYGHLDCIYGKSAVHDVYPHILNALDRHAQDALHLDEIACNCVVKAVASLKSKVCKLTYFQFGHNLSTASELTQNSTVRRTMRHISFAYFLDLKCSLRSKC